MNKTLYIARKAKGLTELQLSKILKIEESEYKEIENELKDITPNISCMLGKLYDLPPDYFMTSEIRTARKHLNVINEVEKIVNNPVYDKVPPGSYISTISLGMKAIEAEEELKIALLENLELLREIKTVRTMYQDLKERLPAIRDKKGNTKGL